LEEPESLAKYSLLLTEYLVFLAETCDGHHPCGFVPTVNEDTVELAFELKDLSANGHLNDREKMDPIVYNILVEVLGVRDSDTACSVNEFLACRALRADGSFTEPKYLTGSLAKFKYVVKAVTVMHAIFYQADYNGLLG